MTTTTVLSTRDEAILAFERDWSGRAGDKASAIMRALAMRPIPYYQALNQLIGTPAALAADPGTVGRLVRQRDTLILRTRRWAI